MTRLCRSDRQERGPAQGRPDAGCPGPGPRSGASPEPLPGLRPHGCGLQQAPPPINAAHTTPLPNAPHQRLRTHKHRWISHLTLPSARGSGTRHRARCRHPRLLCEARSLSLSPPAPTHTSRPARPAPFLCAGPAAFHLYLAPGCLGVPRGPANLPRPPVPSTPRFFAPPNKPPTGAPLSWRVASPRAGMPCASPRSTASSERRRRPATTSLLSPSKNPSARAAGSRGGQCAGKIRSRWPPVFAPVS
jgi:hypothetical protein